MQLQANFFFLAKQLQANLVGRNIRDLRPKNKNIKKAGVREETATTGGAKWNELAAAAATEVWRPARYLWMVIARVECPRPRFSRADTWISGNRPIRNGCEIASSVRPLPFHNGGDASTAHTRSAIRNGWHHGAFSPDKSEFSELLSSLIVTLPLIKYPSAKLTAYEESTIS